MHAWRHTCAACIKKLEFLSFFRIIEILDYDLGSFFRCYNWTLTGFWNHQMFQNLDYKQKKVWKFVCPLFRSWSYQCFEAVLSGLNLCLDIFVLRLQQLSFSHRRNLLLRQEHDLQVCAPWQQVLAGQQERLVLVICLQHGPVGLRLFFQVGPVLFDNSKLFCNVLRVRTWILVLEGSWILGQSC